MMGAPLAEGRPAIIYIEIRCKEIETRWREGKDERDIERRCSFFFFQIVLRSQLRGAVVSCIREGHGLMDKGLENTICVCAFRPE